MRKLTGILSIQLILLAGLPVFAQTPLKPRDSTIKGPQTFAIIMGISKYKYVQPLFYADKDAELFRDYLKSPGGGSVKDENIFCLLNDKANNANFWGKGFQWLKAKNLQRGDRLFIYLAGHGDAIDEDQFFFLGYDCNPGGDKNNYLVGGTIQLFNLKKKIADQTTKGVEVFFIMDACRSNELPGGTDGQNFLNSAISEKQAGEIIMLATAAGEESLEDASIGNGHGLFTYYLVDGLTGVADSVGQQDNKITFREIQNYVDKNVPSVAKQRFNRKQDPFFCCNDQSDHVVSIVDTAYLSRWLKAKKSRGPGNSFHGEIQRRDWQQKADTSLVQLYDLFNKAVSNSNLTGNASAEYFYNNMNKRFPGTPYTLDAKTTLGAELATYSQDKINQYLDCSEPSPKQKREYFEAGNRLEKAIALLKDEEPDFAKSLLNRMYFLKASGDLSPGANNGTMDAAFRNAYAARAIDREGAYINNRLANLHLENNRPDSAEYYARKAINDAPKWKCAYITMSSVFRSMNLPDSASKYQKQSTQADPSKPVIANSPTKKKEAGHFHFGVVVGGGPTKFQPKVTIGSNDSLRSIQTSSRARIDIGFIAQLSVSQNIDWRPSILVSFGGGTMDFTKRSATGGIVTERVELPTTSVAVPIPFVFRFSSKTISPFVSLGPTFFMLINQGNNENKLPIRSFDITGDGGAGVDFPLGNGKWLLSPEIKFSMGLLNSNKDANNFYTNSLSSLKKQALIFSLYLRKQ